MTRESVYWLCQLAGWGAYIGIGAASMLMSGVPARVVGPYGASGATAILLSHGYRFVIRRNGWMNLRLKAQLLRLAFASLAFGIVATALATLVYMLFGFQFENLGQAVAATFTWIVTMLYWSTAYAAVHFYEHYRQSQRQHLELDLVARESQLRALIAQVNPHFLFNSLNSVRALIEEDPDKARDTLTRLSHLLRYSLRSSERRTVPLGEELEAVRNYLDCEAVRYEDRLQLGWYIDDAVLNRPVPPMLVQTLVENAVKHGVGKMSGVGFVRVSAAAKDQGLVVDVRNSGTLGNAPDAGTGLANARARLRLLYNGQATLSVTEQIPGEVIARVELPA